MTRLTTLKISLLSALATLFLLVAMLASSGIASAHTASRQATAFTPQPQLHASVGATLISENCELVFVTGSGFAPGLVRMQAHLWRYPAPALTVSPSVVPANAYGGFFSGLTICGGFGFGSRHNMGILVGIDSNGVQSKPVLV